MSKVDAIVTIHGYNPCTRQKVVRILRRLQSIV